MRTLVNTTSVADRIVEYVAAVGVVAAAWGWWLVEPAAKRTSGSDESPSTAAAG